MEKNKKNSLYLLVGILAALSLFVRVVSSLHLEQTSILFVGLPAIVTVLVIKFAKTPKTARGVAFQSITIFLLMSSVLFGEGLICILMAAPIFYGLGLWGILFPS